MGNYNLLTEYAPFVGLFVGESGAGKSVAEASWVEAGTVTLLDLDKRAKGIQGGENIIGRELLEKNLTIDRSIDTTNGFKALDDRLSILQVKAQMNQKECETLVIDGVGTLTKTLLYDSMRLRATDKGFSGKTRGVLKFPHPDDYNYSSAGIHQLQYNCFLRLKCNFILSGWVVDRWGKDPADNNDYSGNIVIGKKLNLTEKLASEVPGYFDEIYYFSKSETGIGSKPLQFWVEFETSLAKTSNSKLRGLGKLDITGKSFYKMYKTILESKS